MYKAELKSKPFDSIMCDFISFLIFSITCLLGVTGGNCSSASICADLPSFADIMRIALRLLIVSSYGSCSSALIAILNASF